MSHGMHIPDRTIRKDYSKIDFEVRFLSNSPGRRFDIRAPIFGVNTIPEGLQRYRAFYRIEPKQVVYFGRPIRPLSTTHIPDPTACMTQMLSFGQIGLAAPQFPIRLPCNRNIRYRPDKLDAIRIVSGSAGYGMDMFHRAVRHQQSKLMVVVISIDGGTFNCLLHGGTIFRMRALDNKFHGWFRRPVTAEDSEGLVRPGNLSAGDFPCKASGAAQSLRLGQIHF